MKDAENEINDLVTRRAQVFIGYVIADKNKFPCKGSGIFNNYKNLAKKLNDTSKRFMEDPDFKARYPDTVKRLSGLTVLDKPILYSQIKEWNQEKIEKPIIDYYKDSYSEPGK